ncbi:hypothetical protein [Mycolicibacterium sp. J2]|jgi:hypothetical protein|uniref:hypothetical protein n=1 Tax=Mycolicibacterium sp. J2 TaxID=2993511 RepID=UPI00224AA879|nr:hypothetical protein [Mycolicibacterium sp. J2]MCX2710770.1 hypothetical protein [Mycolicibacterium sp. J2]
MLGKHGARLWDRFLDSPFSGLAPWVWMAMLAGPGRYELAVSGALAISVLVLVMCGRRGIPVHVIEFLGVGYFVLMAIIGFFASTATKAWLELWSGDITNALLAGYAVITLMIRRPYTMVYARHRMAPQHWGTSLFVRINMAVTGVWAAVFAVAATGGLIGDAVWHDTDNFWTGWTVQVAALSFGVAFNDLYPERALAIAHAHTEIPSWVRVVEWLPPFVAGTGVAGWLLGALTGAGCAVLVAVGAVSAVLLRRAAHRPVRSEPTAEHSSR